MKNKTRKKLKRIAGRVGTILAIGTVIGIIGAVVMNNFITSRWARDNMIYSKAYVEAEESCHKRKT